MTKSKATRTAPVRFDVHRFRADFEEVMVERRKLLWQVAEEAGLSEPTMFRFLASVHGAGAPGISLDTAVKLAHWAMLDLCNYVVAPEEG